MGCEDRCERDAIRGTGKQAIQADVARTNARSCSSNRSRTSRGSRTAANPVVKVCNSTAVAHDFSWPLPDAQAGAGPGGEPEPDPDTDEDAREEGTRVLSA